MTTNRTLISNSSGKVAVSAVTSTELGYLDGVTSGIQSQLDKKAKMAKTTWGTSLETPKTPHGIVIVNTTIWIIWVAGSAGNFNVSTLKVAGDTNDVTFSCDATTGVVTVTATINSGITYIGRN